MKKFLFTFLLSCIASFFAIGQTYVQSSCGYSLIPGVGTALTSGDDVVTSGVPIGFSFPFYGTNYTTCYVTTNGLLSFNAGIGSGCCSGGTLPNNGFANTIIAWSWDDMYTIGTTQYDYFTTGVAPNRIFVINYNNIGYCCTSANQATVQIQLYETSGEIRILSANNNHAGRTATMGIQSGASGLTVAGRNAASWTSPANECISFAPVPPTPPTVTGFAPTSGCAGSASVVITGTAFLGTTQVTFGGVPALNFTVNSNTQITATPAIAGATGVIAVTNFGGTASSAGTFTVNPKPSPVASVSPVSLCLGASATLSATNLPSSTVTVFTETFANNSQGWTLGTEWQIGSATASSGQAYGNPDPATDNTPTADNGVAGVVIGGNATTAIHSTYYLTSPVINTAGMTNVNLNFYRWLNSDYTPYMQNFVDVFNGSTWVNIWQSGASPGVQDAAWTLQNFNVTAYANAAFQVRFGKVVASGGAYTVSSWNLDDVTITATVPTGLTWTGPATIATPNVATSSVTPVSAGTAVYTVTVTDANGCTGTSTASLAIAPTPTASITQTPASPLPCGVSPTLTAPTGLITPTPGARYYIRDSDPWGSGSFNTGMDAVFGAGNWTAVTYGAANPATIFVPTTQFVYLEGSSGTETGQTNFLAANLPAIEAWVNNGGRILINRAPNSGAATTNFGFGGVTNNYNSAQGTVNVNPAHPIAAGPYTPAGAGPYTGSSYSHAHITGGGTTPIITGGGVNVLTEKQWGNGLALFGGYTAPSFHSPSPNAQNLFQNWINYCANSSLGVTLSYAWTPGGATTQSITANASGTYTVTVTQGSCSATATAAVTLNNPPPASITQTPANPLPCGVNPTLQAPVSAVNRFYVRDSEPWGTSNNTDAMNAVFGAGNYTALNFASATPATVFAPTTQFVFLEGSDQNALAMNNYFAANQVAIEAWVNAGGKLFMNAAPNAGGNMSWGFGGVTLTYPSFQSNATGIVPAHPIFNGPFNPSGVGPYSGGSYAHATISGGGITPLVTNGGLNIFAEKTWGTGKVMFGGVTSPFYHSPAPNAQNLWQNVISYTAGTAPASYTYVWAPGGATTSSITATTTGVYTVTVTAANGCTATSTISVTLNPLPTVTASASSTTVCAGAQITLTGGGAVSYTWTDGSNSYTDGVAFTPAAGTTTYTVTGTNANGCTNTSSVSVTVNALPAVSASSVPSPATVCTGGSVTLNGGGASSYAWTNGVNTPADGVSFVPAASSTYTVTGTDGNGCTATSTLAVTVNALPVVTASATPASICENGTSSLNVIIPAIPVFTESFANNSQGWTLGTEWAIGAATASTGQAYGNPDPATDNTPTADNGVAGMVIGGNTSTALHAPYYLTSPVINLTGLPNATLNFARWLNSDYTPFMQNFVDVFDGSTWVNIWQSGASPGVQDNAWTPQSFNITPYINANFQVRFGMGVAASGAFTVSSWNLDDVSIVTTPTSTVAWTGPATIANPAAATTNVTPLTTGSLTYTVSVTDANGCIGTSTTGISVTPSPTGNTFGTPIVIGTLPYSNSGNNLAANCWTNAFAGANNQSSPDVFYQFVMPSCNDSVVLSLCGSGFDTYVHLLDNGGNSLGFNDDNCGLQSQLNVSNLTPGATYYAVVEGFSGNTGSYTLNVNTYQSSLLVPVTASITPSTGCNSSIAVPNGGGATSYSWSGGLVDGQAFLVLAGTNTYTVTGTSAGCSATATASITGNAASGGLAPATTSTTQNHGDDLNASYYDASCNLIASVDDGVGGNILGLTTATVNVDATAGFHNGQPFVRRWYQITPASNGSADVQLYLTQTDFDNYNSVVTAPYLPLPTGPADVTGIANIRITKNADAGLGNSPLELTPTVSWNGSYWILSFTTPSFSQFRVHSANPGGTPLPVALTKFDGRKLNSSNMLEWSTSSEMNNSHFNLQYSTNGSDFATIAKVDSKAPNGLSSTTINYSFEHLTPALGHNYYRLQQVDLDNQSTLNAKVVDLIWGTNGSTVSIYPNPTQDVLNIDLYTSKVQNTTVKVLDMSGRIVKQIQARSEAGMNKLSISLGEVAGGIYTVQVFENDQLTHVDRVNKK